ncbi:MAG: hypothetical protein OEW87_05625 [Flavobacteriaceae bacterium]|nr:hypothetical protein [Flavobacteriaceae bacterium]
MKIQIIKSVKASISLVLVLTMFACDNSTDIIDSDISGVYQGTLTSKSNGLDITIPATADITMLGDQIQVHCFGEGFDTSLQLGMYQHGQEIMLCLTGIDFENMYGHMLGQGHMGGGMMNDMHNNQTEWMHHLNDEHQDGDEHFGHFNMLTHSFNYTFRMGDMDYHFTGTKN